MSIIDEIISISKDLKYSNEAETRLKIIDRVIFDVLNWKHEDIRVEERVSEDGKTTFADYIIKTANAAVVIEAKKSSVKFDVKDKGRKVTLSKSLVSGALGEAIVQARDYCRQLSIQFAVVTNGEQWIVFPANRIDQVSFHNSNAIVFHSLISILKNDYEEFYSILSRESVVNSSLESNLLGYKDDQIQERRLKNFFRTNSYYVNNNSMYELIEDAITTSFSDTITDMEPSLFEKCYVNTSDRTKFDRRISMHISKSQSLFNKSPIRPLSKSSRNDFREILNKAHKTAKPLAIVVMGTVGAGKTTFQHFTRNVSSKSLFETEINGFYPKWLRVDFLGYTNDQTPVDFIYSELMKIIIEDENLSDYEKCIKKAYEDEIKAIKRGPAFLISKDEGEFNKKIVDLLTKDYNLKKPYIDKLLGYVSGKTPVYIVIDNVDQLEESVQSKIFTESVALSQKLRLNLVISIRSSTYVEHRNSAAFNAFDFDPILIEPPKVEAVLSKRFFLASNILIGRSGEFTSEGGVHFKVDDLSTIINLVQSSVLGTEVGSLMEVLAAGDIRNALRMTRYFLEHGYSNPGKAMQIYQSTGSYTLPRHEALRAIMLGSHSVYSEDTSLIGNPFDSRLNRTNLQMTRLFVLTALVQFSSDSKFQYLDGLEIRKAMRDIGVADDYTMKVLNDLCELRFIHTATHDKASFKSNYYPSRLGGYIVRELISNVTYVENVMSDTFISDDDTWESLTSLGREIQSQSGNVIAKLELRFKKINVFYDYVTSCYSSLLSESQKRALPKEWNTDPLTDARRALEQNMQAAMRSAKRNYG